MVRYASSKRDTRILCGKRRNGNGRANLRLSHASCAKPTYMVPILDYRRGDHRKLRRRQIALLYAAHVSFGVSGTVFIAPSINRWMYGSSPDEVMTAFYVIGLGITTMLVTLLVRRAGATTRIGFWLWIVVVSTMGVGAFILGIALASACSLFF